MEALTTLAEVRIVPTRSGNTRFVARDTDGREYTTFREEIGARAQELEGMSVRVSYHEEKRGRYTNVYLDEIEPSRSGGGADVQEAAWRTAVEAAPWLVGKPAGELPPNELYEKLKPFEERVAEDIEQRSDPRVNGEQSSP
jgi:hypothetical protein